MKLAVPAAEQAWAHTIAKFAASPAPCYEARLLPIYSVSKTLEIALPGYISLYPAEQACKNIAQNGLIVQLGNKTLNRAIEGAWLLRQ